jgi:hypothetical protein
MDKFVAGIGAFIGDFVGAPLDLLKSIVAWALEQLGFENAAKWLESWSFETIINNLIGGVWSLVQGAVDWVKLLFTDPSQALSDLFWGYVGLYETIGEWIYNIAVKPLWTWFENTFPDLSAGIKDLWNTALGGAADLGSWIWDNSLGPLVDWIKDQFGGVAEYFGLDGALGLPDQPATKPQSDLPPDANRRAVRGNPLAFQPDEFQPVQIPTDPRLNIVPKPTGKALGDQQSALDEIRSRGPRGANLVANSGNTTIKQGDTNVINYGNGNAPSAHDPRSSVQRLYVLGYGSRG